MYSWRINEGVNASECANEKCALRCGRNGGSGASSVMWAKCGLSADAKRHRCSALYWIRKNNFQLAIFPSFSLFAMHCTIWCPLFCARFVQLASTHHHILTPFYYSHALHHCVFPSFESVPLFELLNYSPSLSLSLLYLSLSLFDCQCFYTLCDSHNFLALLICWWSMMVITFSFDELISYLDKRQSQIRRCSISSTSKSSNASSIYL